MTHPMPIGNPTIVYGHVNLDNFFGFLTVEIRAPNNLKYPFLPFKLKDQTIFPLGTFTGLYFSEELKFAIKLGYKIRVVGKCYEFKKGQPFDKYINHF